MEIQERLRAFVQRLRRTPAPIADVVALLVVAADQLDELKAKTNQLQAQVDALMLEYCPNEMSPEQFAEWAKHQQPSKVQP